MFSSEYNVTVDTPLELSDYFAPQLFQLTRGYVYVADRPNNATDALLFGISDVKSTVYDVQPPAAARRRRLAHATAPEIALQDANLLPHTDDVYVYPWLANFTASASVRH